MKTSKVILITVLVLVGLIAAGWLISWALTPVQKTGPGNVEAQFTTGYTDMNSMKAVASTVCNFESIATQAAGTSASDQRASQLLQYEANYNRIKGEYDAWAGNIFLGKVIRPADLPMVAPTLDEMKKQVCTH